MNTNTLHHSIPTLSERLRIETSGQHERMHQLMAEADPFSSREQYARFALAQYLFQRDVQALFDDERLAGAVPDLNVRGRQLAALADLADLGAVIPEDEPIASTGVSMPASLGWLYVSEGSTLGAAFLFKEAQDKLGLDENFGARNLAAYPQGRARAWKDFVRALDTAGMSGDEQNLVIKGANQAYYRFGQLLARLYTLP